MTPDGLSEYLTTLGFPETAQLSLDTAQLLESNYLDDENANVAAFARRNWVVHLESEGEFFADGAHADVIKEWLTRIGIRFTRVEDFWLPGTGRVVTAITPTGDTELGIAARNEWPRRSANADVAVLVHAAQAIADTAHSPFRFAVAQTEDETILLVAFPSLLRTQFHFPLFIARQLPAPMRVDPSARVAATRIEHLQNALERLMNPDLAVQRNVASDETKALFRNGCRDSAAVLLQAAASADPEVSDWALRAASDVYAAPIEDLAQLTDYLGRQPKEGS